MGSWVRWDWTLSGTIRDHPVTTGEPQAAGSEIADTVRLGAGKWTVADSLFADYPQIKQSRAVR